ncbi:MAG TPA: electron transfer flavoprotein subunit beta/FixA family protein [Candidatus Ozemobacteraceae bacterium]|nr:electron transfer flavoprotein subunit beta/FixA family protein [Candidatus Ozemobacteraceae bacterium]
MRCIVPIKQVPETNSVKMDEKTGTMIRDGVEAIINPLDLYALEAAFRLRERHGGEVVVLTMGPPKAVTALREAIAMGADGAVLLSDKAFAGADTWATSRVLAAALRRLGFDEQTLILCGERAVDGDTGQTGPALASWLDLPVVTYVSAIDEGGDAAGVGCCRLRRLTEDGYELLEMRLPGVVTVVKEIAAPRLPTLRGKQRARAAEIPCWGRDELDLPPECLGLAGSPTRVVSLARPRVSRTCEKIAAPDAASMRVAAARLAAFLRDRHLV